MPNTPSHPAAQLLAVALGGLVVALGVSVGSLAEASPSFDCRRASTASERAICASPRLASLDRALSAAYRQARRSAGGRLRSILLQDQRDWLSRRDRCRTDRACLEIAMRERIAELGGGAPPPGRAPRAAPVPAPREELRQEPSQEQLGEPLEELRREAPEAPQDLDGAPLAHAPLAHAPLALAPISRATMGPLAVGPDRLEMEGGVVLPLEELAPGVYALTPPVSGELANGRSFCAHMPITFLTLHRNTSGLYVLNAGSWRDPPPTPTEADLHVAGACMMATYEER